WTKRKKEMSSPPPSLRLSLPNGRIEITHPPSPDDDIPIHALYTHPKVLQSLPFWSPNTSLDEVTARREMRTQDPEHFRDFRIRHHGGGGGGDDGVLLGTVGYMFMSPENLSAEAGIVIAPEFHRSGYASEALYLLLEHGFAPLAEGGLEFNRVTFTTANTNVAMRAWLKNVLGATQESHLRQAWKGPGAEFIDATTYSVLSNEWFQGAKSRLKKRVDEAIAKTPKAT
ncbi:hypothetical protein FRB99_003622, partial [Tulasnella sp. 403]